MEAAMKILVIGCGSIGERHIKNLRTLSAGSIIASDVNPDRLRFIKENYSLDVFDDVDEAFDTQPDIVLVCTPPSLHISLAMKAVDHGCHVFIEKPLSHTLEQVDVFLAKAKKKQRIVFVGYNLRFQKGIRLMKQLLEKGAIGKTLSMRAEFGQYLPDWRPSQDYSKSYTAQQSMGGGIILDGSHEIDYVRWFVGEITKVACFAGTLGSLNVDVEDTAEILLKTDNGIIAEIHLDFLQRIYSRTCKIIGTQGTLVWDYTEQQVKLYEAEKKQWQAFPLQTEPNEMYLEEMKHFLDCINGKATPLVDGYAAQKVLEIALGAKKSANIGKAIHL
jgi:predicted dehydrogenase